MNNDILSGKGGSGKKTKVLNLNPSKSKPKGRKAAPKAKG